MVCAPALRMGGDTVLQPVDHRDEAFRRLIGLRLQRLERGARSIAAECEPLLERAVLDLFSEGVERRIVAGERHPGALSRVGAAIYAGIGDPVLELLAGRREGEHGNESHGKADERHRAERVTDFSPSKAS